MADAELLFQWKNDKETIKNSITKRGVTMEEHLKWLEKVVDNPMRQLFILEVEGTSVGQIRLDVEKRKIKSDACTKEATKNEKEIEDNDKELIAEISYGLGMEHRGKGFGKVLLEQAEVLAHVYGIAELTAEVLPHNLASRKLFQKLGYSEEQKDDLYVYRKKYEYKYK